jgi:hypothetical protein
MQQVRDNQQSQAYWGVPNYNMNKYIYTITLEFLLTVTPHQLLESLTPVQRDGSRFTHYPTWIYRG